MEKGKNLSIYVGSNLYASYVELKFSISVCAHIRIKMWWNIYMPTLKYAKLCMGSCSQYKGEHIFVL